ncbi:MAG: hypothetical protein IPI01_17345 [Ignavibacteriae bacterium]|nr:hypothetical protein [Ignavibacteriota bacterium]
MAIDKIPYASLSDLLANEPMAEEDIPTAKIIKRLKHVRVDKELSRGEFLDICYWKSPRGIQAMREEFWNSCRTDHAKGLRNKE